MSAANVQGGGEAPASSVTNGGPGPFGAMVAGPTPRTGGLKKAEDRSHGPACRRGPAALWRWGAWRGPDHLIEKSALRKLNMQERTPTVPNSRTPNDGDYRGDLIDEASVSPVIIILEALAPHLAKHQRSTVRTCFFDVPIWNIKEACSYRASLMFPFGISNERRQVVLNPMGAGSGGSGSVINCRNASNTTLNCFSFCAFSPCC